MARLPIVGASQVASTKGAVMPFDVHPLFQHLKDEAEKAEAEGRKIEAKVISAAKQVETETSDVEVETKAE